MATVHDVAATILSQTGELDTFKLQKLVYYSQAWHLAWDDEPLFREEIQAWANGPVCRALYSKHRGMYRVDSWRWGKLEELTDDQCETVEAVVGAYGRLSGRELSRLTHEEDPWILARRGLRPGERGERVITPEAMQTYYAGLDADPDAPSVFDLV